MTATSSFRPNPDVVVTTLDDGESVLLDLNTRQYYSLNDTGTRVWELLKEGRDVDAIARALTEEWDVSYNEARTYTRTFLNELREEGLVE